MELLVQVNVGDRVEQGLDVSLVWCRSSSFLVILLVAYVVPA